ncbi:hypothetical protein EVAR_18095_1 [Eumeta japonica]|uniref:Uncharacterized protein n=1 Tax=Eumeta variegata TaxID=151549 RepID=A0A4C1VH05_EUMVA|nr:hypothetical protein EVAR_18095_1 [Eumeta japonica]
MDSRVTIPLTVVFTYRWYLASFFMSLKHPGQKNERSPLDELRIPDLLVEGVLFYMDCHLCYQTMSLATGRTTSASPTRPDGTCECRRRVTCPGRRLLRGVAGRMSPETVTVGSVPPARPGAVYGGRVE